jgi:hypothetical protein
VAAGSPFDGQACLDESTADMSSRHFGVALDRFANGLGVGGPSWKGDVETA